MKRVAIILIMGVISGAPLIAQGLTGEYYIPSSEGEIVLYFDIPVQQSIKGRMTDEQGVQYLLEGETEDNISVTGCFP